MKPGIKGRGFSSAARRAAQAEAMRKTRRAEADYVRALKGILRGLHEAYMSHIIPRLSERARSDSYRGDTRAKDWGLQVTFRDGTVKTLQYATRAEAESQVGKHGIRTEIRQRVGGVWYDQHTAETMAAHHAATVDIAAVARDLGEVAAHTLPQISRKVGTAFDIMAGRVSRANREALGTLPGITASDARVAGVLATARDENIRLVENAGRVYAQQVRDVFDDPENYGLRVEGLKAKLLERGDVSESRAELIARDQTLKTNAAVNETRQTNAGVGEYVWSTSKDERVRASHRALDGLTFSWANPPDIDGEPLNPGEDFQCRCVALPVLPEFEGI